MLWENAYRYKKVSTGWRREDCAKIITYTVSGQKTVAFTFQIIVSGSLCNVRNKLENFEI